MRTDFIYDCIPSFVCSCVVNSSRYTGKERDTESGLDYFGARYYASSMGRWMSPDPSGLYFADPTNPQSFNLYGYVANNPLTNADPTGLDCVHINNETGAYEGFESGDCDNSTEEKANSGYYVDGKVNQISFNSQNQVIGYSTSSADGYFPGTPGATSDGGTVANLNPYTGALSNPNQSVHVTANASQPLDTTSLVSPNLLQHYVPDQHFVSAIPPQKN
jgi:RHS repeat-associated protein